MLRKLKWQIPGEPLPARYNWCQGPVPGSGPAIEKRWSNRDGERQKEELKDISDRRLCNSSSSLKVIDVHSTALFTGCSRTPLLNHISSIILENFFKTPPIHKWDLHLCVGGGVICLSTYWFNFDYFKLLPFELHVPPISPPWIFLQRRETFLTVLGIISPAWLHGFALVGKMDCVLHESFTSSQRTALPNQQAPSNNTCSEVETIRIDNLFVHYWKRLHPNLIGLVEITTFWVFKPCKTRRHYRYSKVTCCLASTSAKHTALHSAKLLNAAIRKTPAVKIWNFIKSVNLNDLALLSNVEISTHPGNVDLKNSLPIDQILVFRLLTRWLWSSVLGIPKFRTNKLTEFQGNDAKYSENASPSNP